jgi:hypothetical protein
MPFTSPQLVLAELPEGVTITHPPGLQVGDSIPVPPEVQGRWITIGAGPDQDLILRDDPRSISRSHCRMILRGGAFLIQGRLHPPGHAINGEWFNDCTARPLRDGDQLTIGKHATFRFTLPEQG